jgi:hypothetical protein
LGVEFRASFFIGSSTIKRHPKSCKELDDTIIK